MKNLPTRQQLARIPGLYDTKGIPLKEKTIHLHFHFGISHWFITGFDGDNTLFGFVILNGDLEMAEWGYIPWKFLRTAVIGDYEIENDVEWKVRKACEVGLICEAQNWEKIHCEKGNDHGVYPETDPVS